MWLVTADRYMPFILLCLCGQLVAAESTTTSSVVTLFGVKMHCPTGGKYDAALQRCCTQCERGYGVALPCSTRNDTMCAACRPGVEYSSLVSHTHSCDYCFKCPLNARQTHQCNATHNTKCECIHGYYARSDKHADGRFTCNKCSVCPTGTQIARACDSLSDTVCDPCPPDTFTSLEASTSCYPCSTCPNAIAKKCTREHDTICVGSPLAQNETLLAEMNDNRRTTPNDASFSGTNLVPFYCAFLGAIFIALLIYVIIKRRQHKRKYGASICCCCNDTIAKSNISRDVYTAVPVMAQLGDQCPGLTQPNSNMTARNSTPTPLTRDSINIIGEFLESTNATRNGLPVWQYTARLMGENPRQLSASAWLHDWHQNRAHTSQIPILFGSLRECGGQEIVNFVCNNCPSLNSV